MNNIQRMLESWDVEMNILALQTIYISKDYNEIKRIALPFISDLENKSPVILYVFFLDPYIIYRRSDGKWYANDIAESVARSWFSRWIRQCIFITPKEEYGKRENTENDSL